MRRKPNLKPKREFLLDIRRRVEQGEINAIQWTRLQLRAKRRDSIAIMLKLIDTEISRCTE